MTAKPCPTCQQPISDEEQSKYHNYCRTCRTTRQRWYMRARAMDNQHTIAEIMEFVLANDSGRCQLCNNPFKNSKDQHLDHCHVTGEMRGLLCSNCNHALGKFKDNVELLERAIVYLQRGKTMILNLFSLARQLEAESKKVKPVLDGSVKVQVLTALGEVKNIDGVQYEPSTNALLITLEGIPE